MTELFQLLTEEASRLWNGIRSTPSRDLLQTVPPYDGALFRNPVTGFAILITLAVTSGIAIGALGVFFVASAIVALILTELLGISIEMPPFPH